MRLVYYPKEPSDYDYCKKLHHFTNMADGACPPGTSVSAVNWYFESGNIDVDHN